MDNKIKARCIRIGLFYQGAGVSLKPIVDRGVSFSMDENNRRPKPGWGKWIIAGVLIFFLIAVVLPIFIRARTTTASNACVNNLRQMDAAKQQWALENNKTNLNYVVTWDDIMPYMGRGSEGSPASIHCQDDRTKSYSNTYTLGDLNTKPKCKINPGRHFIN